MSRSIVCVNSIFQLTIFVEFIILDASSHRKNCNFQVKSSPGVIIQSIKTLHRAIVFDFYKFAGRAHHITAPRHHLYGCTYIYMQALQIIKYVITAADRTVTDDEQLLLCIVLSILYIIYIYTCVELISCKLLLLRPKRI